MRAIATADDAILTAPGGRSAFLRVDIKDSSGTFRDLTTYPTLNLVDGARWGEDVDAAGMTATIQLKREVEQFSLSPLMQASPLNLAFGYPGTYAPLLELKREVKIYTVDLPDGSVPDGSTTWRLAFHGKVDHINWGGDQGVEVSCADLQGDIRDAFIERERVYAHADPADGDSTKGLYIWESGRTYAVGDLVFPTEANRNAHFYKATTISTGISGATEPTWPTTGGGTVVDSGVTWTEVGATTTVTGTAVETVMQQLLNDNVVSPPTLTTTVSPLWLIRWYLQSRAPTWDAVRQLATQIGWDLRYWFNTGLGDYRLELRVPDRAKVIPDRTFGASEKFSVSRLELEIGNIRNVIRVVYSDSQDLDAAKQPKRKVVEVSDSASITKYGRRFAEVAEGSASNIDSSAEALALANAILSDLATPVAEQAVDLPFFYAVELGDLYRFNGDGVYHSANLDLAVVKYEHNIDANGARTVLECRGKPSTGRRRWLGKLGDVRQGDVHRFGANNSSNTALSASSVVGGTLLSVAADWGKQALGNGFEFHVSDTPGTAPSTATLVRTGDGNQVIRSDLYPGQTYYSKVIPHGRNATKIVRGQPSAELAFTAGFVEPCHLNPEKFRGELPPNGSFEGFFRGNGSPPDRWEMQTGTWNTDAGAGPAKGGPDARDGARYLRFINTNLATAVRSEWFPVNGGNVHAFTAWVYRNGGSNSVDFQLEWVTATKAAISTTTFSTALSTLIDSAWNFLRTVMTAPATAAFARVITKKSATSTDQFNVDGVKVEDIGEPWVDVVAAGGADPAFKNSWVNFNTGTDFAAGVRCANGEAMLRGIIKSGTVTAAAFTLPTVLRPSKPKRFAVASNALFGEVDINTAGDVIPQVGSNTWFDLSPCRWTIF